MVIVADRFCRLLGIKGIMLFPFCIVRGTSNWYTKEKQTITINHEKIHWQQALEMGIILFYIHYGVQSLFRSYRELSAEKEAFANQHNLDYIKQRKRYAWLKL